jgi:hypothetical protein
MRRLVYANAALAVLLAGHIADHVWRQPASQQLPWPENLPGLLGVMAIAVSLGLALAGHRWALAAAFVVGAATAVGFAAIHLAPEWSMFSDPYGERGLDAASWIQMLASLLGGVVLGAEAVRLRRERRPALAWDAS